MQKLSYIMIDLLHCDFKELEMLLKTNIDIPNSINLIVEDRKEINIKNVYSYGFNYIVFDVFIPIFDDDPFAIDVTDFKINYDGLDTYIYINPQKYDYYWNNYSDYLIEIEKQMMISFELQ